MNSPTRGSSSEGITNSSLTKNLSLSILIRRDGFSFSAFMPQTGKVEFFGFEEAPENQDETTIASAFEGYMGRNSWIANFRSRALVIESRYATLVPASLFDPGSAKSIFNFNFGNITGQDIRVNEVFENSSRLVFALPEALNQSIRSAGYFNHIFSHYTVLLEKQLLMARSASSGNRAFLYIRNDAIDLLVFNGKNLVFQNSFNYTQEVDILYFLTFSLDQLGFGQQGISLEVAGNIQQGSAVFTLLKKYIRNVNFAGHSGEIPDGISPVEYCAHYPLINSSLCVSLAEITGAGI